MCVFFCGSGFVDLDLVLKKLALLVLTLFKVKTSVCCRLKKIALTSVSDPYSLNPDPAKNLNPDPGKFFSPTKKFA